MRFHLLSVLSVLPFGPLSGLATPFPSHWDDLRPKHAWNSVPENLRNLGHPPAETTIDLHIALKAKNENLIDALIEVSSPGHPRQGAHQSREEVAELVAPPSDVLELANAWLKHHGVHPSSISTKHGGSWLTLIGVPVSRANELLRASYQLYQHIGTNDTVLRTLSYGLPAALVKHVQNVAPTTHFGFPRTYRQEPLMRRGSATREQTKVSGGDRGTVLSRRDQFVTPSFLRWFYKTSRYAPLAVDRNVLGVMGFLGNYPNPDELRQFMNQYRFDATSATYSVVQIKDGGYDPSNPSMEANLNIQYTSAISYPTPHIFYSTGGSDTRGDGFINWLDFVLDLSSVPQTVSTPYGFPEYKVPLDYATHVCNLFARLGVRGVSVLSSSGNDGVGRGDCLFQDNSGNSRVQFIPTFPSTYRSLHCPRYSQVPGSPALAERRATTQRLRRVSLVAASRCIFRGRRTRTMLCPPSSGPSVASITAFTSAFASMTCLILTLCYLCSPGGRGVPDIAVQAINFRAIFKQATWTNGGTSCAAPTAAGIISLLNDYRISNGRPPLGFLNVWLYGICLQGLNDIASGSNPGCNTDGFSAVPGWDPVSLVSGLSTLRDWLQYLVVGTDPGKLQRLVALIIPFPNPDCRHSCRHLLDIF